MRPSAQSSGSRGGRGGLVGINLVQTSASAGLPFEAFFIVFSGRPRLMQDETVLESLVGLDPGHPAFVELANRYRARGDYAGALDICFNGLTANPASLGGRVVVARIFYERLQFPLAARELREVLQLAPDNEYVSRLLAALVPGEPFEG